MPRTQEEIYEHYKNKLAPQETGGGLMKFLQLMASQSGPVFSAPPAQSPRPEAKTSVNTRVPDTAKLQANMDRNELMSQFPGMGAR
jgi:hypothetical protein